MKKKIAVAVTAALLTGLFSPAGTWPVAAANKVTQKVTDITNLGSGESLHQEKEDHPAYGYQSPDVEDVAKHICEKKGTDQSCGDNAFWSLENGVLTIAGSGAMTDYRGDAPWQGETGSITSIVIEEGITSIGEWAFYECQNVAQVSIPATVSNISRCAFAECSSLPEVVLPDAVTVLAYGAFADCYALTDINLDHVTTLEDYVFQGITMDRMMIPAGITNISGKAFFKTSIQEYDVAPGNTVYSVQDGILYTDQGQTLFAYPEEKKDVSFTIPDNVTKIGTLAMSFTGHLQEVVFGKSVNTLDEASFQYSGLTSLTIPDSVTTVGMFTFYGCPELTSVTFGNGLEMTSYQMFRECYKLTDIHFSKGLKILDAHTFAYCTSLKSVALPASVQEIGVGCFGECYALTDFSSVSLKMIPYSAFWNCYALKNVTLNEGMTDIYRYSFYWCTSLQEITLPKSVKFVHTDAFPDETVIHCQNAELKPYGKHGFRYLQTVSISGERDYTNAYEVLTLVNEQRARQGLGRLYMDESLLDSAMIRAGENAVCFSHTRPDGSSCFDLNEKICAENVAVGDTTAQQVMEGWMNSEGHRDNILKEDLKTIGIGCFVQNGITYWAQCFGMEERSADCTAPANTVVTQQINLATEKFSEAAVGSGVVFSFGGITEYEYKFLVQLDKYSVKKGEKAVAKLCIINPGFESAKAVLNADGVTFGSTDSGIASVDQAGEVTGAGKGTATITGTLTYYSGSGEIVVLDETKNQKNEVDEQKIAQIRKKLKKGKIQSVKKIGKTSLRVTCKKMTGVSGYQIRLSGSKSMKKGKIKTAVKRKATYKKLKRGKAYYLQARVYKTVSGQKIYGTWGTVKRVNMK